MIEVKFIFLLSITNSRFQRHPYHLHLFSLHFVNSFCTALFGKGVLIYNKYGSGGAVVCMIHQRYQIHIYCVHFHKTFSPYSPITICSGIWISEVKHLKNMHIVVVLHSEYLSESKNPYILWICICALISSLIAGVEEKVRS